MLKKEENAQEILLSDTMSYKSLSMAADWLNSSTMSPMLYISVAVAKKLQNIGKTLQLYLMRILKS